jgi:predicted LPLAT superfamily acyltransferase
LIPVSFQPGAIIPSRNHHAALPGIVASLRRHGLPVIIVDDASDEPARSALAALAASERGVSMHRLEVNQGKGGAVIAGFELAIAAGWTHAVQIDADGQHDLAALPALLAAGRAHPEAIILGAPIYDRSMPLGRRIGRSITHFWVCVETLTLRPLDSMCGFRLYPLAPTLTVLRRERVGRRMDFDPEILVRLLWRGVRPVVVPVRVTYPEGNTSNFRMLRDNWAITRMHTRLVLTMPTRLPSLLRRRPPGEAPSHWARLGERGADWGLRLLAAVYRVLGWHGCMVLLFPVALYFHMTGTEQRRASRDFLRRAFAAQGEPREPGPLDTARHSLGFARKALETFAGWIGADDRVPIEIANPREMDRALADERGLILIVSHLGNADLSRTALDDERRARLTILVHTRHAENYARLLRRFRPEAAFNTLQVTEVDPATIIALQERVERGGWIAIAGDRTPVEGDRRTSSARFLGEAARFPQGPYLLAHLLDCPVYLLFCLNEGGRYRLYFERFADRIELPRRGREAALQEWAARYARRLEAYCLRDPFQWYNFFDFWASAPDKAGTR